MSTPFTEEHTPRFNGITPTSPNDSNSRLKDTVVGGYQTFGPNINNMKTHEDSVGHEFDSQLLLDQYIHKHPTQSRFSLYSMQNIHRLSKLKIDIHATSVASYLPSKTPQIYTFWGVIYRKCCYTHKGMKFILYSNTLLVLLNLFLILYEVVLLLKSSNYLDAHLPITFFICDLIITLILTIEVLLHWYIGYMCSCNEYLCNSTPDNKLDAFVMVLSIFCLTLYVYDFQDSKIESSDIDNLVFLILRIIRDVIRIIRCYLFFKILHENLADFDWDKLDIQEEDFHVHMPVKKMKSVKSDMLWEKYIKEKELHPTVTMLK
eukprot:360882_1